MVYYFEQNIETSLVGNSIASVQCHKCGCDYYYELTRIGKGRAIAPYGIGASLAEDSAEKQSRKNLAKRMDAEAELVPCPNCNWINDYLVAGYRRSRYRQLGWLAAIIAFFGTVCCLFCAWFVANGPAVDRKSLPYFLIYGPIFCLCLAGFCILMRSWLRALIKPNQQFPRAPQLPPGTPPALIANESTGGFEVADTSKPINTSDWHEFQIGRHHLPRLCCSCMGNTQLTSPHVNQVTRSIELEVPRCAACARNAKVRYRKNFLLALIVGLALSFGGPWLFGLGQEAYWITSVSLAFFSLALASFIANQLIIPITIRKVDASRGILRLRFRNPGYGESYVQHNDQSEIARQTKDVKYEWH